MVERAVGLPRGRPVRPFVLGVDDERVGLADELGLHGAALLQVVQVFEEQNPGGLLGVVQLGRAAGLFPEDVVDVLEGLLEHLPTTSLLGNFCKQASICGGVVLCLKLPVHHFAALDP